MDEILQIGKLMEDEAMMTPLFFFEGKAARDGCLTLGDMSLMLMEDAYIVVPLPKGPGC